MLLFLFACATKSISGSIYGADGLPLSEAIITIETQQTVSDANGQFILEPVKLKKGEYTMRVTHEGYVFSESSLDLSGSHFQAPAVTLSPIDVTLPYLKINIDPSAPK